MWVRRWSWFHRSQYRNWRRSKSIDQPKSFGDFPHGTYTGYNRLQTKLTCLPSPYYRREGTTSLPRWRRGTIPHARDTLRSLAKQNGKSTSCASFPYCFPTTTTTRLPERTTSLLQSILIDDNGTPATWTLVLFQQAIDRQDRTSW